MARTLELFDKPPRAKPRVMMHATDHSFCDETPELPEMGYMVCQACKYVGGWYHFANRTEVRRGEPCPKCNGEKQ